MKVTTRGGVRPLVAGVLLAGMGTLGACNFIVGAGKYSVGDVGGGDDGSVGDGMSGSSSGGGMDSGQETGPVTCGNGIATGAGLDQLVESCVLTIGCSAQSSYFFDDITMNFCLTYDYLHSRDAYSGCYTGIHSCGDFFNCSHIRGATVADCPNVGASATCNGNLGVNCTGQATGKVLDCSPSALGGTCMVSNGFAGCAFTTSCGGDAGQCQGNAYYTCNSAGVGFGGNCGTGFTCGVGAGCYFNAPSCASPGASTCKSSGVLDYCSTAKQLFTDNCGLSGSSCQLDDAGNGYCISPGCTIAAQDACQESCSSDGKTLNTCIGGAPFQIDCTKYGTFSTCTQKMDTSVTPNQLITYCQ